VTPRLRLEREDVALLATAVFLVPATWTLFLGWSWGLCVSSYDGARVTLPLLAELAAARGDWSALAYRADWMGGTAVRDTFGAWPVFSWLAAAGLSAMQILNVATFVAQALIGFLGARAARDLARIWLPDLGWSWALRLSGIWLTAFAPYLGWRVGYGHQSLIVGSLPFVASVALVAAARARTLGIVLSLVAAVSVGLGLLFTGHQVVLYGLVFGAPILAGLYLARGRAPCAPLASAGLVVVGAALVASPTIAPVVGYAFSTDSLRALGQTDITYSYLTATPQDFLTSLPWTKGLVPAWRDPILHHETNVPLGPPLVLLALLPWRRLRPLAVGLGASLGLALVLSMNMWPLSDALLFLVPPLRSFRVPTRALWPVCATLPVLVLVAMAALGEATGRWKRTTAAAGAALALGLAVAPPLPREVLGWGLALAAVLARERKQASSFASPFGRAGVAVILAGGSLGAFHERLLPLRAGDALLAEARAVGVMARAAEPALASPLVRLQYGPESDAFGPNTAFAAGLSSLDGHAFPTRRFVALARAVRDEPYSPNALLLRFAVAPSARALFQLYDARFLLGAGPDARHPVVTPLARPAGAAWFPAGLVRTASFATLADELLAAGETLGQRARETLWLVAADPLLAAAPLPDRIDDGCRAAAVESVASLGAGSLAEARVSTAADCPLVLAMNYAEGLRALAEGDGGETRSARVFPAYGALAGIWVPAWTRAVRVTWESPRLPHGGLVRLLGIVLVGVGTVVALRLSATAREA
jgi:hypothetical protein